MAATLLTVTDRTTTWSRSHSYRDNAEELHLPPPIWETNNTRAGVTHGRQTDLANNEALARTLTVAHELALEKQACEMHTEWNARQ